MLTKLRQQLQNQLKRLKVQQLMFIFVILVLVVVVLVEVVQHFMLLKQFYKKN